MLKKQYEEYLDELKISWEVYMKFYVVFLVVNLTAVGLVLEKVKDINSRALIASLFIAQNCITSITLIHMAGLGETGKNKIEKISTALLNDSDGDKLPIEAPVLVETSYCGGMANTIACVAYMIAWSAISILSVF